MSFKTFLIEFWRNEDGFFGIDMGPSSGEVGATNALTGESGFAGSVGEGLLSNSSGIMNALLSGDQGKISQLLAPQIGAISKQANQQTQTNAEFGSRSGGTNASNQDTMDTARAGVNDLISSLTGSAISGAASTGAGLLNSSMSGYNSVFNQANTMQAQNAAQWNDIISGIGQTAGAVAGMPGIGTGLSTGLSSFGSAFGG